MGEEAGLVGVLETVGMLETVGVAEAVGGVDVDAAVRSVADSFDERDATTAVTAAASRTRVSGWGLSN